MIFAATVIISVLGLAAATYTDFKERIVPNRLNFGLAGIGLAIYAAQSVLVASFLPIIYSFWGLIFAFLFGWALWKLGVFAGGDVKLFMGLGALNPFTPALLKTGVLAASQFSLFPVTLFIYSTFAFLPYGLAFVTYRLAKNKKYQKKMWKEMKDRLKQATHFAFFSAGAYVLLANYNVSLWALLPAVIIWGFLGRYKLFATVAVFLAALIMGAGLAVQGLVYTWLIVAGGFTLLKMLFSLRPLLSKEIKVRDLEEGMIPATGLAWKGKKVVKVKPLSLGQIIKYVKKQRLRELFRPGKEIVSARKARGLNGEELKEVKRLAAKGKIGKTIRIKDTLPFVPTILLGYIICLIAGDAWALLAGGF